MKTAWVFPGQGSQYVGMGRDVLHLAIAKKRFAQAEQILGWSVVNACSQTEKLSQTRYTQPCLYVVSAILADMLKAQGRSPDIVAGHSLGEYVALYVAEVFDFENGLQLVKQRAELMNQVSTGMMMALIGADRQQLEARLRHTPNVVLANDNHPGQVVISGLTDAVESLIAEVKMRRTVPLNVSGAFHSPVVADAATAFYAILEAAPFRAAKIPVIPNVEPIPITNAHILKARLMQQMTGAVRWRETVLRLETEGVERVVEVGPGNVLGGLIQRTCDTLAVENLCFNPEYSNSGLSTGQQ
jgi:[acyl-carrier-protein] S-malonyltransferase